MYYTADEIGFINGLGTWRLMPEREGGPKRIIVGQLELLKLYDSALEKRTDWRHLDRAKILNHLSERIRELQEKPYPAPLSAAEVK